MSTTEKKIKRDRKCEKDRGSLDQTVSGVGMPQSAGASSTILPTIFGDEIQPTENTQLTHSLIRAFLNSYFNKHKNNMYKYIPLLFFKNNYK